MEIESSNNDIITELLTRLPAKSLVRFELVSKEWCNIISDNSFQRLHFQTTKPTLSGFFFGDLFDFHHKVKCLSVGCDQSSVHHNVLDFLPENKVSLIASSNGLLCCNTCYNEQVHEGTGDMFIYVCNPATKNFVQIGWPGNNNDVYYFAFAFDLEDIVNFKLIAVQTIDSLCYLFQVYSSKTKEWKKSDVCDYKYYCPNHGGMLCSQVIFASGVVYWMTSGDVILTFDVDKEQSSLIILPVHRIHQAQGLCEACIGESEGQLHFILISDAGLRVWLLNSKTNWVLKHSVSLSAVEKQCPEFIYKEAKRVACIVPERMVVIPTWIEPIVYTEGILLVKLRCSCSYENQHLETCTKIYMYNLDTGTVEELCTLDKLGFEIGFLTTIPYSMSLVPLGSA